MLPSETRRVEAVQTACSIIDALREVNSIGVTALANELEMSKSAVHAHLVTLADCGYVVSDGGQYRLSLQFLEIAEHVKGTFGQYDVIEEELTRLADETGEIAQFATDEHGKIVYLSKAEGENAVRTSSSIGQRGDMHSTSLGKAILSEMQRDRVDSIIDVYGLPQKTPNTITDRDGFHEELARVRERGYTIDDEENIAGVRCIGVPIEGKGDTILGALSITGPASRMTDERIGDELLTVLQRSANIIEINIKFS